MMAASAVVSSAMAGLGPGPGREAVCAARHRVTGNTSITALGMPQIASAATDVQPVLSRIGVQRPDKRGGAAARSLRRGPATWQRGFGGGDNWAITYRNRYTPDTALPEPVLVQQDVQQCCRS